MVLHYLHMPFVRNFGVQNFRTFIIRFFVNVSIWIYLILGLMLHTVPEFHSV